MRREISEMESLAEESAQTVKLSQKLLEALQNERSRAQVSKRMMVLAAGAAAGAAAMPLLDAIKSSTLSCAASSRCTCTDVYSG